MRAWTIALVCSIASLSMACGDDGAPPVDASMLPDSTSRTDTGTSDSSVPEDAGGTTCNGTVCTGGQLCCQIGCGGEMGCTAPEPGGTGCALLGCPPPPERTACGDGSCDRTTEICVAGNFGGPGTPPTCMAVPTGCESDRSCSCVAATYCNIGLMMCSVTGDNAIFCETGLD